MLFFFWLERTSGFIDDCFSVLLYDHIIIPAISALLPWICFIRGYVAVPQGPSTEPFPFTLQNTPGDLGSRNSPGTTWEPRSLHTYLPSGLSSERSASISQIHYHYKHHWHSSPRPSLCRHDNIGNNSMMMQTAERNRKLEGRPPHNAQVHPPSFDLTTSNRPAQRTFYLDFAIHYYIRMTLIDVRTDPLYAIETRHLPPFRRVREVGIVSYAVQTTTSPFVCAKYVYDVYIYLHR